MRIGQRRDESAFTRGDKIMGIPWPAYRRPTAREIKEAKEKAEKEDHNAGEDVDMNEPRDKPVVAGGEAAGTTATGASENKKDDPVPPVTQAPDAPAKPAHPPADALPSQVEARSTLLGVHDTASPLPGICIPVSSYTSTAPRRRGPCCPRPSDRSSRRSVLWPS